MKYTQPLDGLNGQPTGLLLEKFTVFQNCEVQFLVSFEDSLLSSNQGYKISMHLEHLMLHYLYK